LANAEIGRSTNATIALKEVDEAIITDDILAERINSPLNQFF